MDMAVRLRELAGLGVVVGPGLARLEQLAAVGLLSALLGACAPTAEAGRTNGGDGALSNPPAGAGESAVAENAAGPQRLQLEVIAQYPHDPEAYTQGLLWFDGRVYESTGQYGRSRVRRWDLESGRVEVDRALPDDLFGEGLARVEDRLVQITWKAGRAFLWSLDALEPLGELSFRGEGWGLESVGDRLVLSDSTHVLRFLDPATLEQESRLAVRRGGFPADSLNELEFDGTHLWANVYQSDDILRIDPATGVVTGVVDASGLLSPEERRRAEVLNGIAWRPETGTFLITGKHWPRVFEVTIE